MTDHMLEMRIRIPVDLEGLDERKAELRERVADLDPRPSFITAEPEELDREAKARADLFRFWKKVRPTDGCWIWNGHVEKNGYGKFFYAGKMHWAHRWIWQRTHGVLPKGIWVLHRCDNPRCVRLSHLFSGTARDNAQDMVRKGRHWLQRQPERALGEMNTFAKLTTAQVEEIRRRYRMERISMKRLGDQYGVSPTHIWRIINGTSRARG